MVRATRLRACCISLRATTVMGRRSAETTRAVRQHEPRALCARR
jgi:hypothetical protein